MPANQYRKIKKNQNVDAPSHQQQQQHIFILFMFFYRSYPSLSELNVLDVSFGAAVRTECFLLQLHSHSEYHNSSTYIYTHIVLLFSFIMLLFTSGYVILVSHICRLISVYMFGIYSRYIFFIDVFVFFCERNHTHLWIIWYFTLWWLPLLHIIFNSFGRSLLFFFCCLIWSYHP